MKTRHHFRAGCLVLSLLCKGTLVEAGSVYTCTDDRGRKSFSDHPCPAGAEQSDEKADAAGNQHQPSGKQQRKATGNYSGFVNRARGVEKKLDKKR